MSDKIEVFFFRYQVEAAGLLHAWLQAASTLMKELGAYSAMFPSLPQSGLTPLFESDWHRRSDEIVSRAAYVYAWAAFEELLQQCARRILERKPELLIGRGDERRNLALVRRCVTERCDASVMIEHMIEKELKQLAAQGLEQLPRYFRRVLKVVWRQDCVALLRPVYEHRNEAAHAIAFAPTEQQQLNGELNSLATAGEAIARACAQAYALVVRDLPFDIAQESEAKT